MLKIRWVHPEWRKREVKRGNKRESPSPKRWRG